ncbi:MAG: hypothetical protein WBJ41_04720, partial [Chromatiaceae bacterium]
VPASVQIIRVSVNRHAQSWQHTLTLEFQVGRVVQASKPSRSCSAGPQLLQQTPSRDTLRQTFIDRYIEQGRVQGRVQGWEQGIEQGKQQGEAAVLPRLILLKFGPPAWPCTARYQRRIPRPCSAGPSAS